MNFDDLIKPCLLSPYKPKPRGYVQVKVGGKCVMHHRLVYAQANGLTLAELGTLLVRHKCDVRNCIEPTRLELGTNQDNMDDKVARGRSAKGEQHGCAKLTDATVAEIRQLYVTGRYAQRALADKFECSQRTVFNIVNNKNWRSL